MKNGKYTNPYLPEYVTDSYDEDRIIDYGYIQPFGKLKALKYPFVFNVILFYHTLKINTDSIYCAYMKDSLPQSMLESYEKFIHFETKNYYSDESSCGIYENEDTEDSEDIEEREEDFTEELSEAEEKKGENDDDDKFLSFDETIEKYGEQDTKIWTHQHKFFDANIMIFLHNWLKQHTDEKFINADNYLDIAETKFGLMLCVSKETYLIEEIPQYVEWRVDEYDGLEHIRYL